VKGPSRKSLFVAIGLALAASATACARPNAGASAAGSAPDSVARTVFSDTALYRQRCIQADSGLTPASRRCTPRDQGVRVP
jgi:hypothetical protein